VSGGRAEARDRTAGEPAGDPFGPGALDPALYLELDGWEGPLDLLLDLARRHKVDLREISILALADQYLAYIARTETLQLELAAEYLVMAAWLAYLKSALLLPADERPEPDPEELAAALQRRLQRLDAMREAGQRLMARPRLGRDVFRRGSPEGLAVDIERRWSCTPFELVSAYGKLRARTVPVIHQVRDRPVVALEDALDQLRALLAASPDWFALEACLPARFDPGLGRSAIASGFAAALELARTGQAEIAQAAPFRPLRIRTNAR
jgi:segregation and condensation protein A